MRRSILLLLSIALLTGCGQQNNADDSRDHPADAAVTTTQNEEIDGMSIYQLTTPWNTQDGNEITFKDLNGEVLVVVMIYTSCQSACPRLVEDMKKIEAGIAPSVDKGVRYVFVSIDPTYDTPERLKEFSVKNNMSDSRWLFLQGTEESVREFANVVAVRYTRISPIDFSHSNIISVFNQHGVMIHQQEGLASNYQQTVEAVIAASPES